MELDGKTVLLTGATGGLGRAIGRALADRGATLVLSSRKADALNELAASLPGEHRVAPADLGQDHAAERLAADAGSSMAWSRTPGCPAPAGWRASRPKSSSAPFESTSRRR